MRRPPFGQAYADAYDALYADKDYAAECDLLERVFRGYAGADRVRSVLDLGCGTGGHALPLARRGYDVVGVDRSAEMLARAAAKADAAPGGGSVSFSRGDLTSLELGRTFDAALLMFAVLGYQLENAEVLAALRAARAHLVPGGLLFLDVWYGPAVLRERPGQRVKLTDTPGGQLLRVATGALDTRRQVCTVKYALWRIEGDGRVARSEESHRIRFFFARELELLLESAGFALARLGAFPELERDPDESTWNVGLVARAA